MKDTGGLLISKNIWRTCKALQGENLITAGPPPHEVSVPTFPPSFYISIFPLAGRFVKPAPGNSERGRRHRDSDIA